MSPFDIDPIEVDEPSLGERTTLIMPTAKVASMTDLALIAQLIDALRDVLPTAHSFYACTGGRKLRQGKHLDDAEATLAMAQRYLGDLP